MVIIPFLHVVESLVKILNILSRVAQTILLYHAKFFTTSFSMSFFKRKVTTTHFDLFIVESFLVAHKDFLTIIVGHTKTVNSSTDIKALTLWYASHQNT